MNPRIFTGALAVFVLIGIDIVYCQSHILSLQNLYAEAEEYYEQGQILTDAGQLEDALPFYRAANRLFANSTKFLYSLGLSELNNQVHVKAHARFRSLIDLIARGHTDGDAVAQAASFDDDDGLEVEEVSGDIDATLGARIPVPPHENVSAIESLLEECARRIEASPSLTPFEEMRLERRPVVLPMHERLLETILSSGNGDGEDLSLHLRPEFQEPFLVRNCLNGLGLEAHVAVLFAPGGDAPRSSLLPALEARFGRHLVEMYPQNILSPPVKKYTRTLAEALEYIAHPSGAYTAVDASDPGVYLQWSVNSSVLAQLVGLISPSGAELGGAEGGLGGLSPRITASLQQYIQNRCAAWERRVGGNSGERSHGGTAEDANVSSTEIQRALYDYLAAATHWNMVLLGEQGAGMFYHEDLIPVGSFQLQLLGRKDWRICTPRAKDAPVEGDSQTVCYEGSVRAGDLVYYPPSWGHETSSVGRMNAALSSSIILNTGAVDTDDNSAEADGSNHFHRFVRDSCDIEAAGAMREDGAGRKTVSAFVFSTRFCDRIL